MMNDEKRLPVFVGVSRVTVADIRALEEELLEFERKYGIRSETFYAGYITGEEPEHEKWLSKIVGPPGKVPITVFCLGY